MPDTIETPADLDRAVINAAITWSAHHTPNDGPYDKSPAAERARATYRADSETNLHAAVNAMLAEIHRSLTADGYVQAEAER